MTELVKKFMENRNRRAFLRGMGSILDIGATSARIVISVPKASKSPEQAVREAWAKAYPQCKTMHLTKQTK